MNNTCMDSNHWINIKKNYILTTFNTYRYFSVGVANAYQIVTRLDRLMIATKELVGEQFHIQGLPVYMPKRGVA